MPIIFYFKRLQFIDFLIRRKATGSLQVFADKNRLSKNGLLLVLKEMKEMGFPIKYSRSRNTYYYEKDGQMVKTLFMEDTQILTRGDMRKIETKHVNNICFSETTVFELC
jgi:hypothetical protein